MTEDEGAAVGVEAGVLNARDDPGLGPDPHIDDDHEAGLVRTLHHVRKKEGGKTHPSRRGNSQRDQLFLSQDENSVR